MAIDQISTANTFEEWLTTTSTLVAVANNLTNNISYTSGSVTYTTFATFAVKVVMTSSDPTDVPKIKDLRIIALPESL